MQLHPLFLKKVKSCIGFSPRILKENRILANKMKLDPRYEILIATPVNGVEGCMQSNICILIQFLQFDGLHRQSSATFEWLIVSLAHLEITLTMHTL